MREAAALSEVRIDSGVKRFGATLALRGVSAAFQVGELTLIEGANGSGKSTLLGVIGGVMRLSSGTVQFVGETGVVDAAPSGLLGWVSHESLSYADLTGRANVELAARLNGLDVIEGWRRAEERFGLGAYSGRPLRTCSRGQRQRIALARALVHAPAFVLLDEPTTGLDRHGVDQLMKILREELDRGAGICVVSHEPEPFRAMAGARLVLERGRVAVSERFT